MSKSHRRSLLDALRISSIPLKRQSSHTSQYRLNFGHCEIMHGVAAWTQRMSGWMCVWKWLLDETGDCINEREHCLECRQYSKSDKVIFRVLVFRSVQTVVKMIYFRHKTCSLGKVCVCVCVCGGGVCVCVWGGLLSSFVHQ